MKFRFKRTGAIYSVECPETIEIMRASGNYEVVEETTSAPVETPKKKRTKKAE